MIDHLGLFLAALGELLSEPPLAALVQTVKGSDEAVQRATTTQFDLTFCEVFAAPVSGPDLARQASRLKGLGRVVLLADVEDADILLGALRSGAVGFFTKDAAPEEITNAVGAVLGGHCVIGRGLAERALQHIEGAAERTQDGVGAQFSPIEHEIVAMLGQARSVRAIAIASGVSPRTVRHHVTEICRKVLASVRDGRPYRSWTNDR